MDGGVVFVVLTATSVNVGQLGLRISDLFGFNVLLVNDGDGDDDDDKLIGEGGAVGEIGRRVRSSPIIGLSMMMKIRFCFVG